MNLCKFWLSIFSIDYLLNLIIFPIEISGTAVRFLLCSFQLKKTNLFFIYQIFVQIILTAFWQRLQKKLSNLFDFVKAIKIVNLSENKSKRHSPDQSIVRAVSPALLKLYQYCCLQDESIDYNCSINHHKAFWHPDLLRFVECQ